MDYWRNAEETDGTQRQDAAWEEFKSFVLGLPDEEAKALIVRVVLDDVSLAEIYAERGDFEGANRLLESGYQSVLDEYPDPKDQCALGYLALRRHGAELPLSESDFEGHFTFFDDGARLVILASSYEPKLPEFSDSDQLTPLAIRAYGLAWLYYHRSDQQALDPIDAWGDLLALEGLRASFISSGDLEAAAVVCEQFDGWLNEWEHKFKGTGLLEAFLANFSETRGYLRGRKDDDRGGTSLSVAGRDLLVTRKLLSWQLNEILSQVRGQQLSPERLDELAELVADKVAKQMTNAPVYVVEHFEKQLEQEFAGDWRRLSAEVRRLLIQAEYLRSVLHQSVDTDWAPVALHYARAVETQLRLEIGPSLDKRRLNERLNGGFDFRKAIIEKFRNAFQRPDFVKLANEANLPGAKSLAALGPKLDHLLRNYRNPTVHDPEPLSPVKAMEMRKLILAPGVTEPGILWQLASMESAAASP